MKANSSKNSLATGKLLKLTYWTKVGSEKTLGLSSCSAYALQYYRFLRHILSENSKRARRFSPSLYWNVLVYRLTN
jgi:hypothetical protein